MAGGAIPPDRQARWRGTRADASSGREAPAILKLWPAPTRGGSVSPDVSSAQVTIKRRRAWSGSLLPWTVWLDGQIVGKLRVGGSLTIRASPGRHAMMVRQPTLVTANSEPFRFNAEAGERIELLTRAAMISGEARVWRALPPPTTSTVIEGMRYEVIEEKSFEVALNEETRIIDNSESSSSTTRVMRVTREWAKTCTLEANQAKAVRGTAGLGIHALMLEAEATRTLENTYSVTREERRIFVEEVTLNIARHTKSKIIFSWKEIRQAGIVRLSGTDFEMHIPYQVVVGLTFDQKQADILQIQFPACGAASFILRRCATTTFDPILEHFNGTSWKVVTLPSSFSSYGLNAITAQSASDVWVFSNTGSPSVPLLLANWNGSSWTTYPSPLPSDSDVSIGSAASSPSHVWLFGTGPNSDTPLILSYSS
jgi:hypothetical protein